MKLLFVCTLGEHRSPEAAELFSSEHETRSKGVETTLEATDLDWADVVFVMEDWHREAIAERYPGAYLRARIITLGIPDIYDRGSDALRRVLERGVRYQLNRTGSPDA